MSTPDGTRTLREEMDARREGGDRFNLRSIVAMMVPFVTELAERHDMGEELFAHPSAIAYKPSGCRLIGENCQTMPEGQRDRACLAPEVKQGGERGAKASVFSVGAILYELATNEPVGPGMRRPSEITKVPETFELLLSKALIGDIEGRPHDLAALAQALHSCAPTASIPPPAADSMLDDGDGFEVDVSLSMLPPAPPAGAPAIPAPGGVPQMDRGPTSGPVSGPVSTGSANKTAELSQLKASLEADPRPRYIVIKDGMDHGPFTAVELLQQVATGSFREEHFLRDTLSQEERQIIDWEQFAPFAEHARLNRVVEGERKALKATVVKEQRSTQNKALIGGGIFLALAAAFGGWWARTRATDDVRIGVSMDQSQFIDFEGGLEGQGKGPGGKMAGGKWTGGKGSGSGSGSSGSGSSGPPPQIAGGGSCEGARAKYVEDYTKRGVPPDLGASAFSGLNRGTYLNSCGVPPSMSVSICAAVQNGRAVGVTVRTNPSNGGIAGCVRSAVFGMSFPAHPRMDIATTHFKSQ